MNDHETRAAALLDAATSQLTPDVDRLVAGGISRGRAQRRRRRVGTTLAAVAVIGVTGTAASVAAGAGGLHGGRSATVGTSVAAAPSHHAGPSGKPAPSRPAEATTTAPASGATRVAIAPDQVPATVAAILGREGAGPLRTDPAESSYGDDHELTAHFSWQGTLTSVIIETTAADPQTACAAGGPGTTCTADAAGDPVLTWGPTEGDQVTAQGVTVWRRGYEVSVLSYNAAEGKDVAPLMDAPPLSIDDLVRVASSDAWFA